MSSKKTRYAGVYRRPSRRGARFDRFAYKIYDSEAQSKQRWVGGFETAKAAFEAKLDAERQKSTGQSTSNMTVGEYGATWLEDHPRSRSTMSTYSYDIRSFVEAFGDRPLRSIRRLEARRWANVNRHHPVRAALTMLNDAMDDDLLESNPLSRIANPEGLGRRDQVPPSAGEVLALAETALESGKDHSQIVASALLFGFATLMRPSEICALHLEDVDFDEKTIRVWRATDRFGTTGPTKTKSDAKIALVPEAASALKALDQILPSDRDRAFVNPSGNPLRTQTLARWWRSVRAEHTGKTRDERFRTIDWYLATRHAGSTFMKNVLGLGDDDVSVQLRHKEATLVSLYTHPNQAPSLRRILQAWPEDLRKYLGI
jgi:integrase